jgi:hypothetical protein
VDPFIFLRLPIMAFKFWAKHVGVKVLVIGMAICTFAVIIYGCVEGGNW